MEETCRVSRPVSLFLPVTPTTSGKLLLYPGSKIWAWLTGQMHIASWLLVLPSALKQQHYKSPYEAMAFG